MNQTSTGTPRVGDWPSVSIIIAIRNEMDYLKVTLEALARQDYPSEKLEVIVVDDHSSDFTLEELTNVTRQILPNLKSVVLSNDGSGVGYARRTAIGIAAGELLCFNLSAHSVPRQDYIRMLVLRMNSNPQITAVGCRFQPYPQDPPFARAIVRAMTSTLGGYGTSHYWSQKDGFVPAVTYAVIKREVIDRIGGYPVSGDDMEFNLALGKAGYMLYNTSETTVFYRFKRHSVPSFLSRMISYGRSRARLAVRHLSSSQLVYGLPSALLILILGLMLASAWWHMFLGFEILGILALAYLLAIAFEMLINVSRGSGREVVFFLIVYPIIHLGYGIGFLRGLMDHELPKIEDANTDEPKA